MMGTLKGWRSTHGERPALPLGRNYKLCKRNNISSVITHLFLKIKFKTKSPIIDDTRDTSLATRQNKPCCNKNKFSLLLMLNPYESLLPYHFFFKLKSVLSQQRKVIAKNA